FDAICCLTGDPASLIVAGPVRFASSGMLRRNMPTRFHKPEAKVRRVSASAPKVVKQHRPEHERTVLVLQGGGALGAYQAGVYEALHEADVAPDWVTGVSIGAINAAL